MPLLRSFIQFGNRISTNMPLLAELKNSSDLLPTCRSGRSSYAFIPQFDSDQIPAPRIYLINEF